eukprot:g27156.t1
MAAPPPPPAPGAPGPPALPSLNGATLPAPLKFTRKKNKTRPEQQKERRISDTPIPEDGRAECSRAFADALGDKDGLDRKSLEDLFWKLSLDDSDMKLDAIFSSEHPVVNQDGFRAFLDSRPFRRAFAKREEMKTFMTEHLAIKSRCRVLPHDASLADILPKQPLDPNTVMVGFDFDQTVTYVDRSKSKDGKKILAIRGGEKSKDCLLKLKESKIPMCLITAQPPTRKTLKSLRNELHLLGLTQVFDVEKLDPTPLWATITSWGDDATMPLHRLSQKLLMLIVLNSDRFVENVSRIGYSKIRLEYAGEDAHPAWRWHLTSDEPACPAEYNPAYVHPAAWPHTQPPRPLLSRVFYQTANTKNPDMHAEDPDPTGWGGALTLLPADHEQANAMDELEGLFRRQLFTVAPTKDPLLCPVRALAAYLHRTHPFRQELQAADTEEESKFRLDSPNRLLINVDEGKAGIPYTAEELETMVHAVFKEAKVAPQAARDLLEDRAKEITNYKEVKLAHLGNIIASRHNKPEALELFMELRGIKPKTIIFVDDNSDNVYNVFAHFAQKEIAKEENAPAIHTFWYTPPVRSEEANPNIKWTMRKLHESYDQLCFTKMSRPERYR